MRGYTHPPSGFLFYADCGGKMKLNYINRNGKIDFNFNCGKHMRLERARRFTHFMQVKDIAEIVLVSRRLRKYYNAICTSGCVLRMAKGNKQKSKRIARRILPSLHTIADRNLSG